MPLIFWIFAFGVALVLGYGIYHVTQFALVKLSAKNFPEAECMICRAGNKRLYTCRKCHGLICRQHVGVRLRRQEIELIEVEGVERYYFEREHYISTGCLCPDCDTKQIISIVAGVICGDVFLVFLLRWMLHL